MFNIFDISFITTTLLSSIVAFLFYYWYKTYFNHYWKGKGIPHGEPSSAFHFIYSLVIGVKQGKPHQEIENEIYKQHGHVFGGYETTTPVLYVSDPDLLKLIMVKDFSNFDERRPMGSSSQKFYKDFIPFTTGEKWRRLRHIVTPAFTSGKLKAMMGNIIKCADQLSASLARAAESGETINMKIYAGNFSMDAIATVAFGTNLDSHNDPNNSFVQNATKAVSFDATWKLLLFSLSPKLALALGFNSKQCDFFGDLTESIIERRKESKEVRNDFLQNMMEHLADSEISRSKVNDQSHGIISMEELVAQAVQAFLAGFESTSTLIMLTIYHIMTHPEIQDKLVEEVDKYWKNNAVEDLTISSGASYVEACIAETQRIFPGGTRLERRCKQDYVLPGTGITIPKGMIVVIPVYCMHRDERFFPDPLKFSPERFLPENADSIDPYTYMPFGVGPRSCLASRFSLMVVKLCLLHIFKDFEFQTCLETQIPLEFSGSAGMLQPKDVMLKVVKRI